MESALADPRRAATASIAGYAYQFDKTILEILAAGAGVEVTVEGYEDVDLRTASKNTAVQCKYHAAGSFSLRGIRDPLLLMLRSFAAGRRWRYVLYAHYGSQKATVPTTLTVEDLKNALTEDKRKPEIKIRHYDAFDEHVLAAFVQHFEIRQGPDFVTQRSMVSTALANALSSSAVDVAELHYPDAFCTVMDLAMEEHPAARVITRREFVESLDKRQGMFLRWHHEFLGTERFVNAINRQIKSLGLLGSKRHRTLILGADEIESGTDALDIANLITATAGVGFGPGKLSTARPWTVVLDADRNRTLEIKAQLVGLNLVFQDGFEHVEFSPALFDRPVLFNVAKAGSSVTATSFDVRVISLETYVAHLQRLAPPEVLLIFRNDPLVLDLPTPAPRRLDVAGCDIKQIATVLGAFS